MQILRTKYPALTKASDQFSRYDMYTDGAIVELKSRRTNYSSYIIEESKYNALIEEGRRSGREVYYIVSDLNNIYIFDLNIVNIEWRYNTAPTRTDFNGGTTTTRLQGFISIKQAYIPFTKDELKKLIEQYGG